MLVPPSAGLAIWKRDRFLLRPSFHSGRFFTPSTTGGNFRPKNVRTKMCFPCPTPYPAQIALCAVYE